MSEQSAWTSWNFALTLTKNCIELNICMDTMSAYKLMMFWLNKAKNGKQSSDVLTEISGTASDGFWAYINVNLEYHQVVAELEYSHQFFELS